MLRIISGNASVAHVIGVDDDNVWHVSFENLTFVIQLYSMQYQGEAQQ